jgi:hypothetical protein
MDQVSESRFDDADVIEMTLGHLVYPYESYSLPYMINQMLFKVNHLVQGQPRPQPNLFY